MDVILLFPGQGSQKPGMGQELAQAFPAAKEVFQQIDDTLSAPLSTLCFAGPEDELTQTRNAQPALFAHGAAAWAVVRDELAGKVVATAGHSLGELTAYHAAGAVTLSERGAWPRSPAAWGDHVRDRDAAPRHNGGDPGTYADAHRNTV